MAQRKAIDLGVNVGDVILEKYRVESILGHGGMGVVAQCTHLQLGERVAIKLLRPDVLLDSDAVARFEREAKAAAKLKSEYVTRVTDVGTFGETHVPYMVMEFLDGSDLDHLIAERGTLPVAWAVEMMMQAAEALAEAHSLNIVHRDVKPSNLFVTWRPDGAAMIKVLDFGISKSIAGSEMQLTQTQSLLGTPAYMSPEQMRSARLVDSRCDIWSLGTVMYEVIEGHRPFEAESFSEMCVKVTVDPPAPMTKAPPGLQQVILKCLAKTPEQRYASMAELGRDLVPFAPDPHQANMLVERMLRLLRRSQGNNDWDTSNPNTPTPAPGPLAVTPVPGSVVMQIVNVERSRPAMRADLDATAHSPSPPMHRDTNKQRWMVWGAILLVAAIAGIAIGKVAARSSVGTEEHQTVQLEVTQPAAAVPIDAAAPAIVAPVETPPIVPAVPVKDPDVVVEDPKPKKPKNHPTAGIGTGTPKTVPKSHPDPVPTVTPTPTPPPPVKHCDPFAQRTSDCSQK